MEGEETGGENVEELLLSLSSFTVVFLAADFVTDVTVLDFFFPASLSLLSLSLSEPDDDSSSLLLLLSSSSTRRRFAWLLLLLLSVILFDDDTLLFVLLVSDVDDLALEFPFFGGTEESLLLLSSSSDSEEEEDEELSLVDGARVRLFDTVVAVATADFEVDKETVDLPALVTVVVFEGFFTLLLLFTTTAATDFEVFAVNFSSSSSSSELLLSLLEESDDDSFLAGLRVTGVGLVLVTFFDTFSFSSSSLPEEDDSSDPAESEEDAESEEEEDESFFFEDLVTVPLPVTVDDAFGRLFIASCTIVIKSLLIARTQISTSFIENLDTWSKVEATLW